MLVELKFIFELQIEEGKIQRQKFKSRHGINKSNNRRRGEKDDSHNV